MSKEKLSIVTYNIHKGFGIVNFRFVLHQIRESLEAINPDLVFIQEIQGKHSKREAKVENWPDEAQFEFLAENLWPHHVYGKNAIYKHGHHGNAILSKYAFSDWENISLAKHQRASRSMLHATLDIPGLDSKIHMICIHFALFKSQREKQLEALEARINEHIPAHEPVIIAGDFNDWRGQAEQYMEKNLNLKEAFKTLHGSHAKTFPALKPRLAVDRIYYRGIELHSCECLGELPWRYLSDHVPLYAEFNI